MRIKLKTKVALGSIFLFALFIIVAAVCLYFFKKVSDESAAIVKDNYETLHYTNAMLARLDRTHEYKAFEKFDSILRLQEANITEPGEKELTGSLRQHVNRLKQNEKTDSLAVLIRSDISGIITLNLDAINIKNQKAKQSAQKAQTIITVFLSICFLAGFTFLFNFPSLVAAPVAKLTEGIRAIAGKNYEQRIHLRRNDEFGELADAFNSMAERLDEYEHSNLARILFEKQRAETVIHSLKDASIGLDPKGMILFANQPALQLLNLKEEEILGKSKEEVQTKNDLFRFLLNEQNSLPFKIVVAGKENYFTREFIELFQGTESSGSVIVLKNITPFKELDVAKTNFIATISHELKTPLASSDFSLKLLEDERVGTLTAEQKELVQQLKEDNKRLLRILSELLDLSQAESGQIRLNLQPVQPQVLVEKALASVQNMAKEKAITLRKEMPDTLPAVLADADKTVWVLNNFLTNAIRYSDETKEVTVSISSEKNRMIFRVTDQGKGIDKKYLPHIFDRYFKVPESSSQTGTGLGLAISRDFIEAMGGEIQASSIPGEGSVFQFALPLPDQLS